MQSKWQQGRFIYISTNNPTKYDQITSYGFRGVKFTECHGHRPLLFPCHGTAGENYGSSIAGQYKISLARHVIKHRCFIGIRALNQVF